MFPFPFPSLPRGENIHNYFIKAIAITRYFIKSITSSGVALKILREILSFTRSLMINTRPLVGCLENLDRKVKQFRVILRITSSRLVYSSSIQFPKSVSGCTPDSYLESHATDIVLTERLGSNGFH